MNSEKKRLYEPARVIAVCILIGLLAAIYFVVGDGAAVRFGDNYETVWVQHDFYRLFTAIFMHADFHHLWNNCLSLLILGLAFTRKSKPITFYFIFLAGGLIGNIGSVFYHGIMIHDTTTYSLGASGAVYAILGALVIESFVMEHGSDRYGALIYAFLALAISLEQPHIDHAAHLCGLVAGIALEGVLLYIQTQRNLYD